MKKGLLTIVFLSLTGICFGQANAGSQLVSVDMFTGIGGVNIPLHSYQVGDIDVNVSLSYNAKGVPVDELASSVGLGWSLNAGGGISREVRGFEDEVTAPDFIQQIAGPHVYTMGDSMQGILVPELTTSPGYPGDWRYDDADPDIFTLNLGSRTVQFAYKYNNLTPLYITDPHSELRIELFTKDYVAGAYTNVRSGVKKHIGEDSMKNILSFVVTDERGNKFYFERGDYERKLYISLKAGNVQDTNYYYATLTWNLHKVLTTTGEEIRFEYVSKYIDRSSGLSETYEQLSASPPYPLTIQEEFWHGWTTHISKIIYPDRTEVSFDLDQTVNGRCDCQNEYRLKNIIITAEHSPTNKNTLKYRLNQSYFNSPRPYLTAAQLNIPPVCTNIGIGYTSFPPGYPAPDQQKFIDTLFRRGIRLKLNSIDQIGTDNSTTQQYYSFDYNSTALPYRYAPSKDYYGYYNGKTPVGITDYLAPNGTYGTYYTSIPYRASMGIGSSGGGLDRSADINYTQANLLYKITNGMGGITTITYKGDYVLENPVCSYGDLQNYPTPVSEIECNIDTDLEGDQVNDGVIVWKIATTDQFNREADATTEYTYNKGKRFNRGGYTWYQKNTNPSIPKLMYLNNFTVQPDLFHGSNHGFDTTVVKFLGYNNEWISEKRYIFSNLMYDNGSGTQVSCLRKPTGPAFHFARGDFRKFRMGLPLRLDVYDEHHYIISTQIDRYKFVTNPVEVIAYSKRSGPQYPTDPSLDNFGYPAWPYHVIDYETALQDSVATTRFEKDPPGAVKQFTTIYRYFYDLNNNVRSVMWSDSKGDVFKKYHSYNYNYTGTSVTTMNSLGLQHMMSNEVWRMVGNDSFLLSYVLNVPSYVGGIITYPNGYAAALTAGLQASSANNTAFINRAQALSNGSSLGSKFKKVKETTRYDEKYKPIENVEPGENLYECTIWDMDFAQPIASVKNAQHADVAYSSFEGIYSFQSPLNKGNWTFDEGSITSSHTSMTGKYAFPLSSSSGTDIMSNALSPRPYLLSYWLYKPGASSIFSVLLNTGSGSVTLNPVLRRTVGNWKLYTIEFTPTNSTSYVYIYSPIGSVAAPDIYIDELRLHPVEATMRTTQFKPLFGVGSSCDENNNITYFEYDAFGTVKIERDMYKNIRSKTEYVNKESSTSPAAVPQTTY